MVVDYGLAHRSLEGVTQIGIDEIAVFKGHKYLTMVYQLDAGFRMLLWCGPERKIKTLLRFFRMFGKERSAKLSFVCRDMWHPYLKVIAKKAPQALNILDRFHIMKKWGIAHFGTRLSEIIDDEGNTLTQVTRITLRILQEDLGRFSERNKNLEPMMNALTKRDETSRRLQTIPGVGPIVATSLIAVIGNPARFSCGRDMAAYIGLVPHQNTSGDKVRLGRITKKGDTGLRSLLVEGAKSAIRSAETTHSGKMKAGKLRSWVLAIKKRKESPNKVAVALANKMVRMAFAIWRNGTSWHPAA